MMGEYPEHDKLKALRGANQIVGNFIEWLGENGYTICEFDVKRYAGEGAYFATHKNRDALLAQHFEIDQKALDAEKDRMLEEFRQSTAEASG